MLTLLLAIFAALSGPAVGGGDRSRSFSSVVVNHVNGSIGTEMLPVGQGLPVEPAVFVTLGMDRLQVFDHDAVALEAGVFAGPTATVRDAFELEWLKMAVEASYLNVRIPTRVSFAAVAALPAQTLIHAAYAAAQTRPGAVPTLSILVNMAGRGLRAQPVFLLPPEGLELQERSAALGLTIEFDAQGFSVRAPGAAIAQGQRGTSLGAVEAVLASVKKRFPGKESVILVPRGDVTVGQLVALIQVVRTDYPRVVLSLGQPVVV